MRVVKTANGKPCGSIEVINGCFIIKSNTKPKIIINDLLICKNILDKNYDCIQYLYDTYELTIGEIASLFEVSYRTMYKRMRDRGYDTSSKKGRRNSSFGTHFSERRKKNISKGNKGKTAHKVEYERTPEIRKKISETLRHGYQSGRISVNGNGISKAWADGKYTNASMGRGIQGYFRSNKTSRTNGYIYFRSLLELCFLINAEKSERIMSIINEPVHIALPEHGIYIPDFLINETELIELKPANHLLWTKDSDGRFDVEIRAAFDYCKKYGWSFRIVYDKDMNFETGAFKKYLRDNPDIISQYQIRFNNPNQLVGH